jgi:hypothetical protein
MHSSLGTSCNELVKTAVLESVELNTFLTLYNLYFVTTNYVLVLHSLIVILGKGSRVQELQKSSE